MIYKCSKKIDVFWAEFDEIYDHNGDIYCRRYVLEEEAVTLSQVETDSKWNEKL